ncbi:MAG: hypothetical protein OYH76_17670, partial [Defluviicoccus sp.]|nr:hypothetical protein [Defluviicoccus sp.]MDE0277727.1 hypothetical protein [Defluviicoccus sp.]
GREIIRQIRPQTICETTDAHDPWLAGEAVEPGPCPADAMTAHPVSALVNKAANDEPGCVEPVGAGLSIP